jgi:hypothetical protein
LTGCIAVEQQIIVMSITCGSSEKILKTMFLDLRLQPLFRAHQRAQLESNDMGLVMNRGHKLEGRRLATMESMWKAQIHGRVAV